MSIQKRQTKLTTGLAALASATVVLISSCAHESAPKQSYAGKLSYPLTQISLPHGLALTHRAGEVGDEDVQAADPAVKTKSVSTYDLKNADGQLLVTCGSSLSDPKFCGEFEAYYRQYDDLKVFVSKTGRTVLIVEDRSPCYPHIELRVLRQKPDGEWKASKLTPPHFRTDTTKKPVFNPYGSYAGIEGVTDASVLFSHNKSHWTAPFAKIEALGSNPT